MTNVKKTNVNNEKKGEKSIILVPSFTGIIKKDFNLDKSKNIENNENNQEEDINKEKEKEKDLSQNQFDNNNIVESFSQVDESNTVFIEKNKSIIPVPGLSVIVPKDYNIKINNNNNNKNENEKDDKELNNKNNIKNNEINDKEIFESFGGFKEIKDVAQNNNNNINNINNDKNNSNSNNINSKDNNNNKFEKSIIEVPRISQIVGKDFNIVKKENNEKKEVKLIRKNAIVDDDNTENIQKEKEQNQILRNNNNEKKNIFDTNIYTSILLNQGSENDSSDIQKSQSDNTSKSIIPVPGLSQIIKKDYNIESSDNNISEEEKNKFNQEPPIISMKDITISEFNNKNESIKKSNKEEDNKNKSKIIFDLLNSDLPENVDINKNDKNTISLSLIKNNSNDSSASFHLLKNDSNDASSFYLLKSDSNENSELPNNIHNHPLNKYPLSDNICSICSNKKTCQSGFKCDNCLLIICDKCAEFINSNYNLPNNHIHALSLVEKEMFKCNKCQKLDNLNKNFYFCCEECNFGICPKCFLAQNNN